MSRNSNSLLDTKTLNASTEACTEEVWKGATKYGAGAAAAALGANYALNQFVPTYRVFFNKQGRMLAMGCLVVMAMYVGSTRSREACVARQTEVLNRRERQVDAMNAMTSANKLTR